MICHFVHVSLFVRYIWFIHIYIYINIHTFICRLKRKMILFQIVLPKRESEKMTGGTETKTNLRSSEVKLQEVRKIFKNWCMR